MQVLHPVLRVTKLVPTCRSWHATYSAGSRLADRSGLLCFMTLLPIVARELSVAARRPAMYRSRVSACTVAILTMAGLLAAASYIAPAEQGRLLFSILSTGAFIYCFLAGILGTADCLSAEKREGTLGLLFLTNLKGYDVVLGKVASSSLHSLYGLMAIMPVLALALILGGLTGGEVLRITLALLNTLFFSLSAGVLISTISQNERKAMFGTICLLIIGNLVPAGLALALQVTPGSSPFTGAEVLLVPSPIYTFVLTQTVIFGKPLLREFYSSLLAAHLLSWLFLVLASRILPRMCQDRPRSVKRLRWRERWERWSYGGGRARRNLRARMLDRNPFFWLAGRNRLKAYNVWVFLGSMALVWVFGYGVGGDFMFESAVLIFFNLVIHGFLKIWMASEVCSRFVEDRRSGALELLLSSSLAVQEIVRGEQLALRRQFAKPVLAVLALDILLLYRGLVYDDGAPIMIAAGMALLLISFWALRWVAMWQALLVSHLNRALAATVLRMLVLPWAVFFAVYLGVAFGYQLTGKSTSDLPVEALVICWFIIGAANHLLFGSSAKRKFLRGFREMATQTGQPRDHKSQRAARISSLWNWIGRRPEAQPQASEPLIKRHRWAWSLLAVVVLGLGSAYWYRLSLSKQVKARLLALNLAGYSTTPAAFDKLYPHIPRAENAADIFTDAAYYLTPPEFVSKTIPTMGKVPFESRTAPLSSEMKEALGKLRAKNAKALEIVRTGTHLKKSRYHIDPNTVHSPFFNWRQFINIRKLAHVLQLEVILSTEEGKPDQAVQSLDSMFAVLQSLDNTPIHLVRWPRYVSIDMALSALERLLTAHVLSDSGLQQLSDRIRQITDESQAGLERTLRGELCVGVQTYQLSTREFLSRWVPAMPIYQSLLFGSALSLNKAAGRFDRDCLFYLQIMSECLDSTPLQFPQLIKRAAQIEQRIPRDHRMELMMPKPSDSLLPPFERMVTNEAEHCARLRAAQAALAIERWRLKNHDHLPESLEQLSPRWLPDIPTDPFNGEQLLYKQTERGYVIYSVGKDTQDNGGREAQGKLRRPYDITFTVERYIDAHK
jgi:ABC-type transport system involved in cytochrome c biogenesis permease component